MRILITGSEGYIGKNLKKYLIEKDLEVYGLDKKDKSRFRCNIMDVKKLQNVLQKIRPNIVVHLAARTDLNGNNLNEYNENTEGTKNLINVCNTIKSIKKVIFASSMLVHNIKKKNFYKKKNFDPITKYGQSKALMENEIAKSKKNFSWCIIRPTTIWGKKMDNHMKLFLKLIKMNMYFGISYSKPVYKSFGYITNSCYQIYKIICESDIKINSKIFYICDYKPIEMNNWADNISLEIKEKKNFKISYKIIFFFAKIGDLLVKIGFRNFPIQSFRLQNILCGYRVKNNNLRKIATNLPYNLKDSIKEFVNINMK